MYRNLMISLVAILILFAIYLQNNNHESWVLASFEYRSVNKGLISVVIKHPQSWKVEERPFIPANQTSEGSPTWGLQFTKEDNYIFIGFAYSNYPHIVPTDYLPSLQEISFTTANQIDGTIFSGRKKTSKEIQSIGVQYYCKDECGLYGEAEVSRDYYMRNKKEILAIFESLKLH